MIILLLTVRQLKHQRSTISIYVLGREILSLLIPFVDLLVTEVIEKEDPILK